MHREHSLWVASGLVPSDNPMYKRIPVTPLEALQTANQEGAYLLIDRATFLLAVNDGKVREMEVFAESGVDLLNTCSILVRSKEKKGPVLEFADWLREEKAQHIIEEYGKDWKAALPLVTPSSTVEVAPKGKRASRGRTLTAQTSYVSSPPLARTYKSHWCKAHDFRKRHPFSQARQSPTARISI